VNNEERDRQIAMAWQITEEALQLPPADRADYVARRCGETGIPEHEVWECIDKYQLTPAPAEPVLANDASAPRYRLEGVLGRGVDGTVYRAIDIVNNEEVAIKFFNNTQAKPEIDALQRLNDPNIVRFVGGYRLWSQPPRKPDDFDYRGFGYLVMEFVKGGSLEQKVRALGPDGNQSGRLEPRMAAEITRDVAAALAYAHEQGVMHRDIKPANVLLTAEGKAKLADLGLAKFFQPGKPTVETTDAGTLEYMAREQLRGKPTAASDVYGVGVVLYQLLTGMLPFTAKTNSKIIDNIRYKLPVRPRKINRNIPQALETICLRCLCKIQRHRPGAAVVRENLDRFLNGQPITLRPLGRASRFTEWCYAKPATTAIGMLLLLLLLIPGAVYLRGQLTVRAVRSEAIKVFTSIDNVHNRLLYEELEARNRHLFGMLDVTRTTREQAHPPELTEPTEKGLVSDLSQLRKKLESSSHQEEAHPWLVLCDAELALLRGDHQEAVRLTSPASLPVQRDQLYWFHRLRGIAHFCLEDYKAASDDFARTTDITPNGGIAWVSRGDAEVEAGQTVEGLRSLNTALLHLSGRPNATRKSEWRAEAHANYSIGRAHLQDQRPQQAIAPLEEALKPWNDPAQPRDKIFATFSVNAAIAHGRTGAHDNAKGRTDTAISTYRSLQQIAPLRRVDRSNYGIALFTRLSANMAKRRPAEALPDADEAIALLTPLDEVGLLGNVYLLRSVAHLWLATPGIRQAQLFGNCDVAFAGSASPVIVSARFVGIQALLSESCSSAVADARSALPLFGKAGDRKGQASTHTQLIACYETIENLPAALRAADEAMRLADGAANPQMLAVLQQTRLELQRRLRINP
jgi:serine/threonine protein kinase